MILTQEWKHSTTLYYKHTFLLVHQSCQDPLMNSIADPTSVSNQSRRCVHWLIYIHLSDDNPPYLQIINQNIKWYIISGHVVFPNQNWFEHRLIFPPSKSDISKSLNFWIFPLSDHYDLCCIHVIYITIVMAERRSPVNNAYNRN